LELHVVGEATEQGHREMSVGVYEAWKHNFALCIDLNISRARAGFSYFSDDAVTDEDGRVAEYVSLLVLCHNPIGVPDD
jgi:hypothetical protein